jgi:CelD/BcsL family acetyltransferase involved in cellulose biosynthesis
MKIAAIETFADFQSLRTQWDDLVNLSGGSLYSSWAWLAAAWRASGDSCRPAAITVSQDDQLLAAAAFRRSRSTYYRVDFSEVSFLGDGISDQHEFLCRPGRQDAIEAVWRFLGSNPWRAELLRLEQLPEHSPTLTTGRATLTRMEIEPASVVPRMPVRGSWDDYLQSVPWELRRDLRRSEKRLAEVGQWQVRHLGGTAALEHVSTLKDMELAGYKSDAGKAFFAEQKHEAFARDCLGLLHDDSVVLTLLELEGRVIAYILGFVHRGTYYAYNTSFDESLRKAGPGKYVYARAIQQAFERGVSEINFARGESHIKSRFGGKPSVNHRAVLFYPGLKGSAVRLAAFRIRPLLKSLSERSSRKHAHSGAR